MGSERVRDRFHDALNGINKQAEFFALAIKLRMRSANVFFIDQLNDEDKPLVSKFRAGVPANGSLTFEALYASICFHFEEFIREAHRVIVEDINALYSRVDDVFPSLFQNHVTATGEILARHQRDARAAKVDVNMYARNVGGCVPQSATYKLNSDAFTFYLHGVSTSEIENVFNKIGMKIDWDAFGRNNDLKAFFGGGGVREVRKQIVNFIDEFVSNRNRLVHRGGGCPQISEAEIVSAVSFFRSFSAEFSSTLSAFTKNYQKEAS